MLEVLCSSDVNARKRHNSGRIRASGIETDVALQPVEDPALVAEVTEAYRAKYANQPSLVAMFLWPPGTEATLRVDQR
jgi:hypothetical protein